jgi:RNA polymerase sigma-70 factor (TIGR02960 family)
VAAVSIQEELVMRARAGDDDAFRALTEPYERELQFHCYRILGSLQDAEDLVQETLLAAWRGLQRFEGRSSPRVWLYRIATNKCLNARRDSQRRPQERQLMVEIPAPTRRVDPLWLEPYPDALLEGIPDTSPGPEARFEMREAVGLAFMVALQHLPPRQRATLVLRDVLGFHAAEVADMLDTSEVAVKAALQRARSALDARLPSGSPEHAPLPHSPQEQALAGRFAAAVERGDVTGLVSLLSDDAWLTMPPEPYAYNGHAAISRFLRARVPLFGGQLRLVPTRANGQPAFGAYLRDPPAAVARFYGLLVLTLDGDRISAITWFGDRGLFGHFGLSRTIQA